MNIKITNKDGLTLKTKGKYCKEDISVAVDESILGITPSGTYEVTDNGKYDITEYAKVNVNVASSGGGDTTQEDGLIEGTITEYTNNRITKVGKHVFYYNNILTKVNLPNVTNISDYAFSRCSALTNLDLPNVTNVEQYVFSNCSALTRVNLPNVTYLGMYAFEYCSKLTNLDLPKVTNMGFYTFQYCYLLESVSLKITNLGNYVFRNCYSLKAVILKTDKVCTLGSTNAFTNCYHILGTVNATYNPDGLKDAYIYVPDELVESYKSATNWSTYADQIKPLSEYVEA